MWSKFFTVPQLLFLIFLVLGQSHPGFGEDSASGEQAFVGPQSFTAVSSVFFTPGTDYRVFFTVNPHTNDEPMQLKCVLMASSSKNTIIESESISLRPQESGQISIPLPLEMPRNETAWRLFAWHFTEDSIPTGYVYEAPHTLIHSSLADADRQAKTKVDLQAIFIQTDKPAYKPDDLVRIRVITMGSDDRPHLTAGVNMTITDSQGNLLKKWEQPFQLPKSASLPSNVSSKGHGNVALFGEFQKKKNGLSSYEYQLSSEPILGNWTIQVQAGNITELMYFDVQRYILPKFQVKIKVPPVLYGKGDIRATAKIEVTYTYGKGLQGTGTVNASSGNDGRTTVQQFVVEAGEAVVPITLSRYNPSRPSTHTITANVTEKGTGRWQIGKATVRVFPQEKYTVKWINKPSSYKPGLPLTVQLKITGQDGYPVKDVRENALRITFPSSLKLPVKETSIQLSGMANFTFLIPLQPIPANSQFTVEYKSVPHYFPLPKVAVGTSDGIFIEVVPPSEPVHLIQGHSYSFTIRSNKPTQPDVFHCILWDDAAMQVHGAQTIFNNHTKPATEFQFSLELPKAAYTDLKIFIYFETGPVGGEQIISTSKSINTHNYLKIRVSRPIPKKAPAPPPPRAPGSDNPVETTSAPTTSIPETTEDYDYDQIPSDDPGAGVQVEDPQPSDKLQVGPGDAVEIHFETYPDSTIAIRGIDQSLLLLTEQDNDLNQEAIESKRASSQPRESHLDNVPADNSSFLQTFRKVGISVLNSAKFVAFEQKLTGTDNLLAEGDVSVDENAPPDESSIPQVDTRLRTKFPETWLWEEFESNGDGSITVRNHTLPDTLTSWIISGFSLNPRTGLGVASPATITGFMPFFVTLNLPYSVFKLETFDIQAIVHNYLEREVTVFVTLYNRHGKFDFENSTKSNQTRSVQVLPNHAALVRFSITTLEMGEIPIEVKAVTEGGAEGDSMLRYLKVMPDGVRETRSQVVMFDPKPGVKNRSQNASFEVAFPKLVVKGASTLQLTVVGDPMGTIVSNVGSSSSSPTLGHLLQVPYGCGEQNMITLVPNILALHYLNATESKARDVIQQATRNLEKGYGQQLRYRKLDTGGFSVFTRTSGTTWLTAYVLQWFVVSQKYITVDPNVIQGAINFTRTTQQANGSFVEVGPFYHPEMRVGTGSGVGLTAFITLAFIQAHKASKNNDLGLKVAIQNGMKYISRQAVYDLDDNYVTNLVTATLMAGNHQERNRFFRKMEQSAKSPITAGGVKVKYWDMKNERERASDPLAIEMTSYALLAHLWKKGGTDSSVKDIHRWLLNKRNPNGGFISTQDTMMGLTALTEFALRTKIKYLDTDELQLNIRTSSPSRVNADLLVVNSEERNVSVVRWNRMVLQEFTLPPSTEKVSLEARGSGPALIQLTESWYVPIKNGSTRDPPDHFNITAKMTIPDPNQPTDTDLNICVNSYRTSGSRDSIASVQLPTGYVFFGEDYEPGSEFMAQRPGNVQRFELTEGNSKLNIYYTEIKGYPPTCLSLVASQEFEIKNSKNPPIRVYEYLNPAIKGIISYKSAHKIKACQLCPVTGNCGEEDCD